MLSRLNPTWRDISLRVVRFARLCVRSLRVCACVICARRVFVCEKKERKRGERARINEARKWNIRTFLKGRSDSHFPLVLEREYAFLSLSSLCLSLSLILFLREFSTCLSFSLILLLHEFTIYYFWRMVCCSRFPPLLFIIVRVFLSQRLFLTLSLSLSHSVITLSFILIPILIPRYVTLHLRIANHLVMDSCCRGGIVNIRSGCSCVRSIRPKSPTALWRFRVSTSNSPSSRTWPPAYTPIRYIYQTCAQQDIRVCGDDHFQPPDRQYSNSKALSLLRVSI